MLKVLKKVLHLYLHLRGMLKIDKFLKETKVKMFFAFLQKSGHPSDT